MAALDLEDVTLVGNDTGGALCQLVTGRHPERLARLALTNCDAFENFPPQAFRGLVIAARTHTLTAAMQPMRRRSVRRLPLAYGWLTKRPIPDDVLDGWVEPFLSDRAIRRDTRRFLAAVDPAFLHDNVARLMEFDRPVLIAWAPRTGSSRSTTRGGWPPCSGRARRGGRRRADVHQLDQPDRLRPSCCGRLCARRLRGSEPAGAMWDRAAGSRP